MTNWWRSDEAPDPGATENAQIKYLMKLLEVKRRRIGTLETQLQTLRMHMGIQDEEVKAELSALKQAHERLTGHAHSPFIVRKGYAPKRPWWRRLFGRA